MFFLQEPFLGGPLALVQLAFTVGMLVHLYRRGTETWWWWIILFFQPVGAWIYFAVVLLPSLRTSRGLIPHWQFERKLSLEELHYRAERTPTLVNRVALAERLMEKGRHEEAIPLLQAALRMEETHCVALHDLALCHLHCKQHDKALDRLIRLIEHDPRWSDYRAWKTLLEAQDAKGLSEDALQTCRELAKKSPTMENKCLLAERLLDQKLPREAYDLLDQALEDYDFMTWRRKLSNYRWARRARQLLRETNL